ncbi:MAG: hypothetical protein RIR76_2521 [Verrucomicrobiota bacterium]|jgi:hypothetical protein
MKTLLPVLLLALSTALGAATELARAAQPQLAVNAKGTVWVAFGRGPEIHVARSDDGGATFATPVTVASLPSLMLGRRRGPRIVAHGEILTATAMAGDLHAFRSADGGRTWKGPFRVNDTVRSAREGLNGLTVAPDGRVFATWLDLRGERTQLFGAESADGGQTWSANRLIYRAPSGQTICECCHPSVAFNARGDLRVMWRNALEGARDMWSAERPAGAEEFGPARKLGEGSWMLKACPMDGGVLFPAADGFGTVWQRAGRVFHARPGLGERELGPGTQPVATTVGGSTITVWQNGKELWTKHVETDGPGTLLTPEGRFPSLVSLQGSSGALVAYERGDGIVIESVGLR